MIRTLSLQDRLLLEAVQTGLTPDARPFAAVARRFRLSETALCARLRHWQRKGLLRYAGAVLDMGALGFVSGLAALRVPPGRMAKAVRAVNALAQVSHNYERDGRYNLWFTLNAPSEKIYRALLRFLRRTTGAEDLLDLRTERLYKRRAVFALTSGLPGKPADHAPGRRRRRVSGAAARGFDPAMLALLAEPFPLAPRPFLLLAGSAGRAERDIVDALRAAIRTGVVRRIGVQLAHGSVGVSANALVAWRVPQSRRDACGRALASGVEVSHCYARKAYVRWPFNVYTMVHASAPEALEAVILRMARRIRCSDYRVLATVREHKKIKTDLRAVLRQR